MGLQDNWRRRLRDWPPWPPRFSLIIGVLALLVFGGIALVDANSSADPRDYAQGVPGNVVVLRSARWLDLGAELTDAPSLTPLPAAVMDARGASVTLPHRLPKNLASASISWYSLPVTLAAVVPGTPAGGVCVPRWSSSASVWLDGKQLVASATGGTRHARLEPPAVRWPAARTGGGGAPARPAPARTARPGAGPVRDLVRGRAAGAPRVRRPGRSARAAHLRLGPADRDDGSGRARHGAAAARRQRWLVCHDGAAVGRPAGHFTRHAGRLAGAKLDAALLCHPDGVRRADVHVLPALFAQRRGPCWSASCCSRMPAPS